MEKPELASYLYTKYTLTMKSAEYEHLRLKNQICHRLYLSSNALTRAYKPLLEKLKISYPQYIVMMSLWENDEVSMGALAQHTYMDKGFLTTLVQKLNKERLVKISFDPKDKRKKIITLTQKGWSLREKASSIPEKMMCKYQPSSGVDFNKLVKSLDEIIKALHK